MDAVIYGILLFVIAALLTWIIRKSKREGWDKDIKAKIDDYYFIFQITGTIIKDIDKQLYDEMDDVLKALDEVYSKDSVSKDDVQMLIDEAEDVFNRATALYNEKVNG